MLKKSGGGNLQDKLAINDSPVSQYTFITHIKEYLDGQSSSLSNLQDTNTRTYYRCENGVNGFYGMVEEYAVPQQVKDIDSFRLLRIIPPGSAHISGEKRFVFSGNYAYDTKIFSNFNVQYNSLGIQSKPSSIITLYFDSANEFYKIEMKFGRLSEDNVLKFYTNGIDKIADFGNEKEIYWAGGAKNGRYSVRFSDTEKDKFILKELKLTPIDKDGYYEILTYNMVKDALPLELLVSGWYGSEKTHIWGMKNTEMTIPVKKELRNNDSISLIIKGWLYFNKNKDPQKLEFYIDERLIKEYDVRDNSNTEYVIDIPKEYIKSILNLNIKTSYEASPKEETGSNDGRMLAFALTGIEVK